MNWISRIFERRKDELEEEIQTHIRMDVLARMERGETRAEAEAAARHEFGNVALVRDVTHDHWRWNRLERLGQNLRYAVRVLRRSPGFSITVVLTLAVGVGATCAMFTVVDRVLLQTLPYPHANRLVQILELGKRGAVQYGSPYLDIEQWQKRGHAFSQIAFYQTAGKRISFLEGKNGDSHVLSTEIGGSLFPVLGVHPVLGRDFQQDPASGGVKADDAHSLMLSDDAWRTDYGADPGIVGKVVHLRGEAFTVIGVMPRSFVFPVERSLPMVWTPIVLGAKDATRERNVSPTYQTIARLQPQATLKQADAELKAIQPDIARAYTDSYDREDVSSIEVKSYSESLTDSKVQKALLALFGASGLLWLIACLNVTSLMLARATSRRREIAVRGALGASRWQIVQQLLIEGLLLSGCGSLLGLGLAVGILKIFEHALTMQFSIHETLTPDITVLAGLLVLTIVSSLLVCVWPAIGAARAEIEPALRQGSLQGTGQTKHRTRAVLVITEIALSLTLLVGCGLLLRTIYALKHVPLGFRTDHILVANMTIPSYKFTGTNMTTGFYQPLVDRVKQLPGVQSASLMTEVPLGKTYGMIFTLGVEGKSAADVRKRDLKAQFRAVGPEMQKVFGFHMVRGRFFNEQDTATSQAIVIVNRAFVKAYFGDDRDPGKMIGEHLLSLDSKRDTTVQGILDDERQVNVADPSKPEIEVCISQLAPDSDFYKFAEGVEMDLAVRTDLSPSVMVPELRKVMRAASPDLADSNFTTMDQVVEDSFGDQALAAKLLEIFAGSALLLCIAGIYGLLAYLVAQRTREMGLRIALGAQRSNVMWLVLRQAGWMLVAGLSAGLGLAYVATQGLKTFLYEVKSNDPWTMAAVTLMLLIGGLAASWLPARRAASVDPMKALRTE
ncbi:ABC transporter permease [Acidicapsa ligni]|uniref:ABC transporter permease n=1 Tax=Acidicapsa ligni TaxID=542300 RepID=UPI0021DF6F6D|nr:ABC transporter permease [Acidicapsa ligni]